MIWRIIKWVLAVIGLFFALLFGCMWLDVHAAETPIVGKKGAEVPGDTLVPAIFRGIIGGEQPHNQSRRQETQYRGGPYPGEPLPEGMGFPREQQPYDPNQRQETAFRGQREPLPGGMSFWQKQQAGKYNSHSAGDSRYAMSKDQLDALGISLEDYRRFKIVELLRKHGRPPQAPLVILPDGTILGQSDERMALRTVVVDSVVFDAADSLAEITLNMVPTNTQRRTAPTSSDKITVSGPFLIDSYNDILGTVTVKSLFNPDSNYITVSLSVQ